MTSRARIISRPVAAILLAVSLTACGSEVAEGPAPTAPDAVETSEEATPGAELNAPGQLPEETVESFFTAADAAAADGWLDLAYIDAFLTSDVAELTREQDQENAESGAVITGKRELSQWTVFEETDTSALVEFCNDSSEMEIIRQGQEPEPVETLAVGQFSLIRGSVDEPWLIAEMGFYPEGTTCDEHFSRYDD